MEVSKPTVIETEGLGTLHAHRMTLRAEAEFEKRVKDTFDTLGDQALVRHYIGCVSGLPIEDAEKFPPPLTEEQVGQLTDQDIETFAQRYLDQVVGEAEGADDPIGRLAAYVRKERQQYLDSMKKVAEQIKSAFNMAGTAELMKNWGGLDKTLGGSILEFRSQMEKTFSPMVAATAKVGEALKRFETKTNFQSVIDQLSKPVVKMEVPKLPAYDVPLPSRPRALDTAKLFEHMGESPVVRTADAIEEMKGDSKHVRDSVNMLVQHAGEASSRISEVLTTIQAEAEKSGRSARKALWISIGAAFLAILVSVVGIIADRIDAADGDAMALRQAKALEAHNALLVQVLAESRRQKVVVVQAPPPAPPVEEVAKKAFVTPDKE